MEHAKCVVVGDGAVGKTCCLVSYTTNSFPTDYCPTVFDNYSAHLMVNNKTCVNLGLWDTAGQDDYDRLRPLSYPQTDVFVVCFAVTSPTSFRNVQTKWIPEVKHYMPSASIILVGTKKDMRGCTSTAKHLEMMGERLVLEEEGHELARKMGCAQYIEVSALTQENLHYMFQRATEEGLATQKKPKKKSKQCVIM